MTVGILGVWNMDTQRYCVADHAQTTVVKGTWSRSPWIAVTRGLSLSPDRISSVRRCSLMIPPCNQIRSVYEPAEPNIARDGVDAALSPTAAQCAKLVMLTSQEKREGIHEGN